MPFEITSQPVKLLIDGHDSEGRLIFADDQLSAVVVRLDGQTHQPEHKGLWHLEAGLAGAMCALHPRLSPRRQRPKPG